MIPPAGEQDGNSGEAGRRRDLGIFLAMSGPCARCGNAIRGNVENGRVLQEAVHSLGCKRHPPGCMSGPGGRPPGRRSFAVRSTAFVGISWRSLAGALRITRTRDGWKSQNRCCLRNTRVLVGTQLYQAAGEAAPNQGLVGGGQSCEDLPCMPAKPQNSREICIADSAMTGRGPRLVNCLVRRFARKRNCLSRIDSSKE